MRNTATLVFTTFLFFVITSCQAQKTLITKDELPKVAQGFISDNFSDYTLDYIVKKVKLTSTKYEVKFEGRLEIKFDSKGNWKEVDGKKKPIPTEFIPKKIRNYVIEKFSNAQITKIEKERFGKIEIKLSNSMELVFNSEGDFLGIDD